MAFGLLATPFLVLSCMAAPVRRVHSVDISVEQATVRVNQTLSLWAQAYPLAAEESMREITWTSSNSDVVEVEGDGTLIAISPGTATITAETPNGTRATCTVTVPRRILEGMETDIENKELSRTAIQGGAFLSAAVLRLDVEAAIKEAKREPTVRLTYQGKTQVSTAAVGSAAYTAALADKTATLRFQTMTSGDSSAGKKKIQGQLTIRAEDVSGKKEEDILLGVFTEATKTKTQKQQAEKTFGRPVEVVILAQKGAFPTAVNIAAKLDKTRLNGGELVLYYRDEVGTYKKLANQSYYWDTNGYLHFTTQMGGTIAVTAKI